MFSKLLTTAATTATDTDNLSNGGIMDTLLENFDFSQGIKTLSWQGILLALLTSVICGLVIYLVYRFFYKGVVYSENFNILLLMVTVVTAFIITTISANIVLSLGMVGALSIVRFRSAVKDPLDVGFLFWGVGAGITAGAGIYWVAVLGTVVVALVFMGATIMKKDKKTYLLIVRYEESADKEIAELLNTIKYKLKNKTVSEAGTELTVEIKLEKNDTTRLTAFRAVKGVSTVTLLEYSGEYMS